MSDLQHIRQDIHAEMLMPNSGLRGSELRSEPLFLWYDYFSCPQIEKKDLPKAIDSIPGYIARCAFFFVLAPVIEAPSLSKVFTPSTWADRAWCRVERLCRALSQEGSFILIKSHTQFELSSTHVGSFGGPPGEGSFTVTADRCKLGPVLQKALHRKLLMLLEAEDLVGYRVIFNLQSVLLRGFMVQPIHTIVPANREINSKMDVASHVVDEFLLQNGFATIDEVDSCGWSPMLYAALRGEPLLIQSLLERHADPNSKAKKANPKHGTTLPGVTSLDLCLVHKNNDAARLLLEAKASVSTWAMSSACIADNAEGVRMLCEAGGSPHSRDEFGTSAICTACMFGSVSAFEELVAQAGHVLTQAQMSQALDNAMIFRGRGELVQQLIHLRADAKLSCS